ncbi:type I restriction endonuclease subunit R, EcoR124 family, partial [Nocardia gipuzkoensis]
LDELHKTFATLTQEEQKYANLILHDIQSGLLIPDESMSFRDYISEYQAKAQYDQINKISDILGVDESKLRNLMNLNVNADNINEFGRFYELTKTVDKNKAKAYFQEIEGKEIKPFQINIKVDEILRKFILEGGFDI